MFDKLQSVALLDGWVRNRASKLGHVTETIALWGAMDVDKATSHFETGSREALVEYWDCLEGPFMRGLVWLAVDLVIRYKKTNSRLDLKDRDAVLCVHWLLSQQSADPTILGLPPMDNVRPKKKPNGEGYYLSRYTLASFLYDTWPGWSKPWGRIVEDALGTIEIDLQIPDETASLTVVDPPPLTGKQRAAYELLIKQPPHVAMTAREICDALARLTPPIYLDEDGFRKNIVPKLISGYGLKSYKNKGYQIPPSKRPPATS